MPIITGSVGRDGVNRSQDVRLVQRLLNDARSAANDPLINVSGTADSATQAAIEQYQRQRGLAVDGQIGPSSQTLRRLVHDFIRSLADGFVYPPSVVGMAPLSDAQLDLLMAQMEEELSKLGN